MEEREGKQARIDRLHWRVVAPDRLWSRPLSQRPLETVTAKGSAGCLPQTLPHGLQNFLTKEPVLKVGLLLELRSSKDTSNHDTQQIHWPTDHGPALSKRLLEPRSGLAAGPESPRLHYSGGGFWTRRLTESRVTVGKNISKGQGRARETRRFHMQTVHKPGIKWAAAAKIETSDFILQSDRFNWEKPVWGVAGVIRHHWRLIHWGNPSLGLRMMYADKLDLFWPSQVGFRGEILETEKQKIIFISQGGTCLGFLTQDEERAREDEVREEDDELDPRRRRTQDTGGGRIWFTSEWAGGD